MSFTESLDEIVGRSDQPLLGKHPSWERVRLAEIASVLNGFAFPSSGFHSHEGTPLIRIRDISSIDTDAKYRGEFDPLYLVESGDILVGMDGDFNCAVWRGSRALLNQRVCKIVSDGRFYKEQFLFYALPGYLRAINDETSAITVKHLSSRTLLEVPLPLPSVAEQERIVGEIEKQFTRLDAAMTALKRVQANLKRYRAAVLKAACEGRLVSTTNGVETYSKSPVVELLAQPLANGRSPAGAREGFKILRLTAIQDGRINMNEWRRGPVSESWKQNLSIQQGDILVSRGNGSKALVGLAGLVGDTSAESEPILFPDTMIRIRPNRAVCDARYFVLIWNSRIMRDQIERTARTTAGIHKIAQSDIERFEIPHPSLDVQRAIVAVAEKALTTLRHTAQALEKLAIRSSSMRASILSSAFTGQLIPQDPTDESASALLERIRTERAAIDSQRSARRSRKETAHA